ncbi:MULTISPECIES: hypothetical protein [unclassified Chelatococcus]|uniref:phage tail assembly chaperone n=1 Tax=unclassified Chelatococcus TaxID=2638111 RepID=UPI001BCCE170|nr:MULTISPECIES: hypothetical protein [unclassified Chelatococcus]MBS7696271.1 hypothetical protein [Chelatococcus sp. YT9]MBX3560054.1 hypothetical protein [Chelatococcus sp.]
MLPPDLSLIEAEIAEAFNELGSDRQIFFGIGCIPFTSIDRYAERYGFDTLEEFDFLRRALRAMDAKFLELNSKPTKKA